MRIKDAGFGAQALREARGCSASTGTPNFSWVGRIKKGFVQRSSWAQSNNEPSGLEPL
jgi:hypothetical protein